MPKRKREKNFSLLSHTTQNRILRVHRETRDLFSSDSENEENSTSAKTANNTSSETLENLTSSDRSSSRGSEKLEVNSVDFFDDSQSDTSSKLDGLFENDIVYERRLGFDELSENEQTANRNVDEEARLEGDVYENDFDDPNERSDSNVSELDDSDRSFHEDSSTEYSDANASDEENFHLPNENRLRVDLDHDDRPLYDGAPITVKESIISTFMLVLKHRLTGVCLSDLLEWLEMHCKKPNLCCKTLYKFRKHFANLKTPITRKFYCSNCLIILKDEKSNCLTCNQIPHKNDYFISLPFTNQLQKQYNRPDFVEKLNYKNNREKENFFHLEDIYDGEICKMLSEETEILSNYRNIGLIWYTDGVSIYKSSKFGIWAFYFLNINLPPDERYKPENLVFGGLWFGEKKPIPNLFLLPIKDECVKLYRGINVGTVENPQIIRGIVMGGTCDSPARTLFLNMTQFNGRYGCQKCEEKGESIDNRWVYPYKKTVHMRTDEETALYARRADNSSEPVIGVKGSSAISLFVYKPVRTTGIDVMHNIYKGLAEQLLNLWTNSKFSNESFSIAYALELIDSRLCAISPPSFVQRRPRSIGIHLSHWKASESRNWFYYMSLVILKDIMDKDYYEHHKLIVLGMYLLNKSISIDTIQTVSKILNRYVSQFERLYGKEHMSSNVHQILHLPDVVKDFGPLWTLSCFSFEDVNGKIKNLVHGSNSAQLQICNSLYMLMETFNLNRCLTEGTSAYAFCQRVNSNTKQLKSFKIENSLYIVGTMKRLINITNYDEANLLSNLITGKNVFKFLRFQKSKYLFTSEEYTRQTVTYSKCVKYHLNNSPYYGIVKYYLKITECECVKSCLCEGQYYAVIKNLKIIDNLLKNPFREINDSFIYSCSIDEEIVTIDIHNIICLCFFMYIRDKNTSYVAEPINVFEEKHT